MTHPECGLTVVNQQSPRDRTKRRIVVGCPYAAAGLCPNGDRLPMEGDDLDPNDPTFPGRVRLLQGLNQIVKATCPGPQTP